MAWYRAGAVNVTNGSTAVTGTNTRWASNARVGDAFRGPDGYWYEIVNIASETTLGILPAYQGATSANNANYGITPIQGYVKESADRLRQVTDGLEDIEQDVEDAKFASTEAQRFASNADSYQQAARNSQTAAAASQTAAKTSETNAKASETAAGTSRTQAATSATNASTSATNAANSATAAKTSETNAKTSETNAKTSETNAATSRNQASTSATAAATSATTAKTSEDAAKASQTAASASQSAAATSASNASGSATAAANSATASQTARTGSETARNQAQTAEANAKKWATNPVNTAVESGSYSALHWATKAKESADLATGSQGPRLTSIAAAVLAVNDMLIADTTTTMAKIATGTMGRTLLGTANAAAARNALELKPGATLDVTTTIYDDTVTSSLGALMRTGAFGLGSIDLVDIASTVDLNTVNATGFYQVVAGSPNSPGLSGQMIVMTNATYYSTQIFSPQDKTSRLFIRSSNRLGTTNAADYGPWVELAGKNDITTALTNVGLGLTNATVAIPANTNLNTYQTTGLYGQAQNGQASTANNYPVAKAGSLFVQNGGSSITTQVYIEYDTGTMWSRARYNTSWSAWKQQWDSSTLEKTVGQVDPTPGRITKVGDFGLGVNTGQPIIPEGLDSITTPSGFYGVADTANSTFPEGAGRYGFVHVERYSGVLLKQTYTVNGDNSTVPGFTYERTYNRLTNAWNPWTKMARNDELTAWGVNANIGNTSGTSFCANCDDFNLPNGLYGCDSGTSGTKPPNQTWGTLLVMGRNFSTGRVVQVWNETDNAQMTTRSWRRLNYGRSWGQWIQDFSFNDLNSATRFNGEISVYAANQLRLNNGGADSPSVIHRTDASNYYMLLTDAGNGAGGFNSLRPFVIGLSSGLVSMNQGATTASPSSGDRSNRVATSTWVGSEFDRFGVGSSNAPTTTNVTTSPSGNYYYPAGSSPYPDFAFVQRLAFGTSRGFEVGNIPYTDRLFLRASNSDGTWRTPVEMAKLSDLNSKENTISAGNTSQFWRGDKTWQDFGNMTRGQALTGLNTGLTGTLGTGDSIINAFGKLQNQITTNNNAIIGDNTNIARIRANKYFDPIIVANATGTYNLDLSNTSAFELTLTGNTTLAFTNVPSIPANTLMTVVVTVKQGSSARVLTLPSNLTVIATGGTIAIPGANKQQDYIFTTKNGTAWEVRAGAST